MTITYRERWQIRRSGHDWLYFHKDHDGLADNRFGYAPTIKAALNAIADYEAENGVQRETFQ